MKRILRATRHGRAVRRATEVPPSGLQCVGRPRGIGTDVPKTGHQWHEQRRAFTLLEAVLALAMLTAVIVVCLQLRAQVGVVGRQVERISARDNASEAIFQSLVNGLLGPPTETRENGVLVWEGEQNGAKYRIIRTMTRVPNPVVGQVAFDVPATLTAYKYEITFGTAKSEFIWHR